MVKQYVIGIDIGTSGCKALMIDERGQIVARAFEEYPLFSPSQDWYEQNPEDWWQAVKGTIGCLLKDFDAAHNIKAIGLSGQMHGIVAMSKDATVLRPCMIWADLRNGKQCQEIYERVGGVEALLQLTNNRMLTGYTGGKILWVRENEPEVYEQIHLILNPKDYIRFRLTGEYATDVSDASGTGLFDVRNRTWCQKLLDILDIPKELFPRSYESVEITGKVTEFVATELGLPVGIPVVGGGGDAVIQSTGTGLVEPGIFGTTIGTGGIVATALDQCYSNPEGRLQVFCNNMPGKWHTMGVTLTAGGALKWLKDIWASSEVEVAKWTGEDVYQIMNREAAQVVPGSEGLLFLPHLVGARCPHPDPNARGAFIGLTMRHNRGHFIRSLLEGTVLSLRDITEVIKKMGVTSPIQLRTSGGGAQSQFWRQIQADVFNCEIVTMSGAAEGGAYGAALVAGAGVGVWPTVEEAVQVLQVETSTTPIRENVQVYDHLFPIYQGLYAALQNTFNQLASLPKI